MVSGYINQPTTVAQKKETSFEKKRKTREKNENVVTFYNP